MIASDWSNQQACISKVADWTDLRPSPPAHRYLRRGSKRYHIMALSEHELHEKANGRKQPQDKTWRRFPSRLISRLFALQPSASPPPPPQALVLRFWASRLGDLQRTQSVSPARFSGLTTVAAVKSHNIPKRHLLCLCMCNTCHKLTRRTIGVPEPTFTSDTQKTCIPAIYVARSSPILIPSRSIDTIHTWQPLPVLPRSGQSFPYHTLLQELF